MIIYDYINDPVNNYINNLICDLWGMWRNSYERSS